MQMDSYIWAMSLDATSRLIFMHGLRAIGNRVLMVSGSDEHGTPITVTAEQEGVGPQDIVDKFHSINTQALLNLGWVWEPNIDPRGIDYGGALFNRLVIKSTNR